MVTHPGFSAQPSDRVKTQDTYADVNGRLHPQRRAGTTAGCTGCTSSEDADALVAADGGRTKRTVGREGIGCATGHDLFKAGQRDRVLVLTF